MIDTTRRALFAGAASLTALSVPAVAAAARTPMHDVSLLRCIAAHRRARRVADAWEDTVFAPAYAAYQNALEAVPHYTTKETWKAYDGQQLHMTTDCETMRRHIESQRLTPVGFGDDDFGRCCAELDVAMRERDALLEQINAEWKATGLTDRSNQLGDITFDKFGAIIGCPVHTVADLILKLDTIQSVDPDDDTYPTARVLADLNRIAGRA